MIVGILPYVEITKLDPGCKFGDKCMCSHKEVDGQPNKKAEKSGGKGSVAFDEEFEPTGLRIPGNGAAETQVDVTKGHTILGTEAQRALLKRYSRHVKIRERMGPSQGVLQRSEPHERRPQCSQI